MSYSLLEWFSVISLILNFSRLLLIKAGLNRLKLIKATGWHKFNLSRLFSNPGTIVRGCGQCGVWIRGMFYGLCVVVLRVVFSVALRIVGGWRERRPTRMRACRKLRFAVKRYYLSHTKCVGIL